MKMIPSPFTFNRSRPASPRTPQIVTAIVLSGILCLAGCGRSDEEPAPAASPTPASSAAAETPAAADPMTSPTPSPTASPLAETPGATPPKTLYVVTAFEAVSELGTHQFPVGAEVNVMEEDGDDYLVEYHGVAVRNGKEFFSETRTGEAAPTPVAAAAASPLASPEPASPSEPMTPTEPASSPGPLASPESGLAAPNATPDPQMAAEEEKSAELLGEIRTLNEEIRQAEEAQQRTTTSDSQGGDSTKVRKLKERRDALSEDLTDFAKP